MGELNSTADFFTLGRYKYGDKVRSTARKAVIKRFDVRFGSTSARRNGFERHLDRKGNYRPRPADRSVSRVA